MKKSTSSTIDTSKDYFTPKEAEPDCPHSKNCSSKGFKCRSCKHNKKKDYYQPENPWKWAPNTTPTPYVLPKDHPLPTVTYTLLI